MMSFAKAVLLSFVLFLPYTPAYEPTGLNAAGMVLCVAGMVIFVLLNNNIGKPLDNMLGSHWGHFARRMITILYYTALYLMFIKFVMKYIRKTQ